MEQGSARERICVIGCSGGGKSTLAALVAEKLQLPRLELDSVFHQPNWSSLSTAEFRARVERFSAQERWIIDGNYVSQIGDIVWGRASEIVWMDTSRGVATARVLRRTLRRLLLRKELWNDNRERLREVLSPDPERSIVVWAWKKHSKYTYRYEAAMRDPTLKHINFVRLRTRRDLRRYLHSLD